MEEGVKRWVVDISKWNPQSTNFSLALSLLPSQQHSSITRYCFYLFINQFNILTMIIINHDVVVVVFWCCVVLLSARFYKFEDRKRALISQMLQYALLYDLIKINIPFIIKRTSQNKPFLDLLDYDKLGLTIFPNFNFNVSHHGDYVAIASEPLCLVGIDIVSFDIPQGGETVAEFIQCFSSYFSTFEWDNIVNAATSNDVLIEFYKYVHFAYTLSVYFYRGNIIIRGLLDL
jgi:4'-phosphopantetheinyl transferase